MIKNLFKKFFSEKICIKIICLCIALVLGISAFIIAFSSNKKEKKEAHFHFAESFVSSFISDNPAEQYDFLDISVINPDRDFQQAVRESYKRAPLVKKHHSVAITNTREATGAVVKKINNVYASYSKGMGLENSFVADTAYRYNVKIKYKGKQIHNVSFWVVKRGEELKICTVYEYERSLDRCFAAGMY